MHLQLCFLEYLLSKAVGRYGRRLPRLLVEWVREYNALNKDGGAYAVGGDEATVQGDGSVQRCGTKTVQGSGKSENSDQRFCLDIRTSRRIIRASVVDNEQLTHKETGKFRLWINEPDGRRKMRMRLVINNLHPRVMWRARTWINVRLSHNHS
jgi:hypothetical protein